MAKWALFDGKTMVSQGAASSREDGLALPEADRGLMCASGDTSVWEDALSSVRFPLTTLGVDMPLPIRLDYKTPATLGCDRVAAACGAWGLHPGQPSLIIDAGTCITVDYLDAEGVYHGGAIMPGLNMSLRALGTFTAKLPLVSIDGVDTARVLGRSTEECIVAGTLGATMLALAGFVAVYREKSPALHVLLTGGDAGRLTRSGAAGWEVAPALTLIGLNEILNHDEE